MKIVTIDETVWAELPDRQEAGSPNVIGAVAIGVACDTLAAAGMDRIAAEERELPRTPASGSSASRASSTTASGRPTTRASACSPSTCRRAVRPAGGGPLGRARHRHPPRLLLRPPARCAAAARGRCRGAPPDRREMRAGHHERLPGAARMSLGLGSTTADVDALADALRAIAADGPRWTYAVNPAAASTSPIPIRGRSPRCRCASSSTLTATASRLDRRAMRPACPAPYELT